MGSFRGKIPSFKLLWMFGTWPQSDIFRYSKIEYCIQTAGGVLFTSEMHQEFPCTTGKVSGEADC